MPFSSTVWHPRRLQGLPRPKRLLLPAKGGELSVGFQRRLSFAPFAIACGSRLELDTAEQTQAGHSRTANS
jgi:hypothetical protein